MSTKILSALPLMGGFGFGCGGIASVYASHYLKKQKQQQQPKQQADETRSRKARSVREETPIALKLQSEVPAEKLEDFFDLGSIISDPFSRFNDVGKSSRGTITHITKNNGEFGLKPRHCFKTWFPGNEYGESRVRINPQLNSMDERNTSTLRVKEPTKANDTGAPKGCATMAMFDKGNNFLFNSEVTVRNEKVGLALWTGLKTQETSPKLILKMIKLLVLLEKSGSSWEIKGGYGREDTIKVDEGKHVMIMSPDGKSIRKKFTSGTGESAQVEKQTFSGVWKSDDFALLQALEPQKEAYPTDTDLTFAGIHFHKYGTIIAFLNLNKKQEVDGPWLQYKSQNGQQEAINLVVKDSVDKWFEPFRGWYGEWSKKPLNQISH